MNLTLSLPMYDIYNKRKVFDFALKKPQPELMKITKTYPPTTQSKTFI